MVDEQMHDRFGDLVSDGFADDVEVGRNQGADEFCFQGFPLCEFGIALRGLMLVRIDISRLTGVRRERMMETYKLRIIVIVTLT